jgi:transposase
LQISDFRLQIFNLETSDYCRQIETYLCQKNDGHLIRVVGPSFEMVSRWASDGVPLKVAFGGIDRYFERYYRKGPRRRPVHIDFCEADVLDVFDEWRRATGLTASAASGEPGSPSSRRGHSLPEHLERVLVRLTNARATDVVGPGVDRLIEQLSGELDRARAAAGGVRGDARRALLERLVAADAALLAEARLAVGDAALDDVCREAQAELSVVGEHMAPDDFARARERAFDRLVRERLGLPTIAFS